VLYKSSYFFLSYYLRPPPPVLEHQAYANVPAQSRWMERVVALTNSKFFKSSPSRVVSWISMIYPSHLAALSSGTFFKSSPSRMVSWISVIHPSHLVESCRSATIQHNWDCAWVQTAKRHVREADLWKFWHFVARLLFFLAVIVDVMQLLIKVLRL
jgi:hypothetical protein